MWLVPSRWPHLLVAQSVTRQPSRNEQDTCIGHAQCCPSQDLRRCRGRNRHLPMHRKEHGADLSRFLRRSQPVSGTPASSPAGAAPNRSAHRTARSRRLRIANTDITRGTALLLTVDYSNPASYQESWGGVFFVRAGPRAAIALAGIGCPIPLDLADPGRIAPAQLETSPGRGADWVSLVRGLTTWLPR